MSSMPVRESMSMTVDLVQHLRHHLHQHHQLNPVPIAQIRTRSDRRIVLIPQVQNVTAISSTRNLAAVIDRPANVPTLCRHRHNPVLQGIFEAATNCSHFHYAPIRNAYLSRLRPCRISQRANFLATIGISRTPPVVLLRR